MGWIIFAVWMVLGLIVNIFMLGYKNAETEKEKRSAEIGWKTCMWIGIVILGVGLLYCLGWVWYWVCGGFFMMEEPTFLGKIGWGLVSVASLGMIVGTIAMFFGWDPDK